MRPIQQKLNGFLFDKAGQKALLLAESGPAYYLRFAYVRRGLETNIFPSFLLDDWGTEIGKLELYRWVAEFGEQFPRAEVFGLTTGDEELQIFLRDLEIHMRLPVFAFPYRDATAAEGVQIYSFIRLGNDEPLLMSGVKPTGLKPPLEQAALNWGVGDREGLLAAGYEAWSWPAAPAKE